MLSSYVQQSDVMNHMDLEPHNNLENTCHVKKKYTKIYGIIPFI